MRTRRGGVLIVTGHQKPELARVATWNGRTRRVDGRIAARRELQLWKGCAKERGLVGLASERGAIERTARGRGSYLTCSKTQTQTQVPEQTGARGPSSRWAARNSRCRQRQASRSTKRLESRAAKFANGARRPCRRLRARRASSQARYILAESEAW